MAADTISCRYGVFKSQLSVDALEAYANHGAPSTDLAFLLKLVDPQVLNLLEVQEQIQATRFF